MTYRYLYSVTVLSQELDAVNQQLLKFQTTLSVSTVRPENSPEQILEVILSALVRTLGWLVTRSVMYCD